MSAEYVTRAHRPRQSRSGAVGGRERHPSARARAAAGLRYQPARQSADAGGRRVRRWGVARRWSTSYSPCSGRARAWTAPPSNWRPRLSADRRGTGPKISTSIVSDVILEHRGRRIRPKTQNQKAYVDAIRSNTITFGIGPAGTGKTYLAMAMATARSFCPATWPASFSPGRRWRRARSWAFCPGD